jgi:predicted MFS family arabinose efflux permease
VLAAHGRTVTGETGATTGRSGERARLRLLQLTGLTSSSDRFSLAPLIVVIAIDMRAPLVAVIAVASAYYLAYGLMQPVWGLVSDRIGRVRVMRIALLGAALAGLASAVAPNLLVLGVSRTLAAGCVAALIPATLVYVGDMWPPQVRQRPLAEVLTASSLGTALATAGAGVAAELVGWRAVPAATGVAAAVLWVALRRLPEPEHEPATGNPMRSIAAVVRHRWAQAVLLLVLVEGAVVLGVVTYLAPSVQALGASTAVAGLVAASFGAGAVVLSRVVRLLVGHLSAPGLAAVGAAMLVAGWAVPALGVSLLTVTIGGALVGGSWAFLHTTLQSWATEVVPGERATMIALFAALLFLGGSLGTAVLAPLAEAAAFDTVFRAALTVSVPLAIAAVLARRRYGDRGTVGPAPAAD